MHEMLPLKITQYKHQDDLDSLLNTTNQLKNN